MFNFPWKDGNHSSHNQHSEFAFLAVQSGANHLDNDSASVYFVMHPSRLCIYVGSFNKIRLGLDFNFHCHCVKHFP